MSKELPNKKWSCQKIPYETKKIAKRVLKVIKKQKGRKEKRTYFCKTCDAWHLTKIKKRFPIHMRKK